MLDTITARSMARLAITYVWVTRSMRCQEAYRKIPHLCEYKYTHINKTLNDKKTLFYYFDAALVF